MNKTIFEHSNNWFFRNENNQKVFCFIGETKDSYKEYPIFEYAGFHYVFSDTEKGFSEKQHCFIRKENPKLDVKINELGFLTLESRIEFRQIQLSTPFEVPRNLHLTPFLPE